jgi:predicted dehydrogenase
MTTDWGAHHFDIAQWGIGYAESGPVEVHAAASGDYPSLTYKYANGVTLHHWFGPNTRQYKLPDGKNGVNGVLFVGDKGWVECNRGFIDSNPRSLTRTPDGQQKEMLTFGPNEIRLYRSPGHHADWLNCMKTRARPVADVEIGCRSATTCHLGNISHWTGRSFKWDPAKEDIIGDPSLAQWLDRPKRAPWTLL